MLCTKIAAEQLNRTIKQRAKRILFTRLKKKKQQNSSIGQALKLKHTTLYV